MLKKIPWYALRKDTVILNFSLLFGTFILGSAMFNIMEFAALVDGDEYTYFPLGTIMVIVAYLFICLFAGWQDEAQTFHLAVSMGETRKHFFLTYAWQNYLLRLLSWAAMNLCYLADRAIAFAVAESKGVTFVSIEMFDGIFSWQTYLLVPLLFTALTLFIGGVGLRMGTNTRWFVMGLYLVILFLVNVGLRNLDPDLLFAELGKIIYAAVAAMIVLMILIAVVLMRKQQVNA